jgi:hypothetical protein
MKRTRIYVPLVVEQKWSCMDSVPAGTVIIKQGEQQELDENGDAQQEPTAVKREENINNLRRKSQQQSLSYQPDAISHLVLAQAIPLSIRLLALECLTALVGLGRDCILGSCQLYSAMHWPQLRQRQRQRQQQDRLSLLTVYRKCNH